MSMDEARLVAAATIYAHGLRDGRLPALAFTACAEWVRGLEQELAAANQGHTWADLEEQRISAAVLVEQIQKLQRDFNAAIEQRDHALQAFNEAIGQRDNARQSRMRLEEISEAARGLTMLTTTENGGVVIGPQGWYGLMATLARVYDYTSERPMKLAIGVHEVLFANDRQRADEPNAWKYKFLPNGTWSVGYETFREAYDVAYAETAPL